MIDSKTKLLGLIGHPVEHSLSPVMHNRALMDKNLNYVYLAFDVKPENLKYVIDGAKALGMVGFNVTIPHKIDIMNYLDDIDEGARLIGAVNTVKIEEDGRAIGYNTDGLGARMSLEEEIGEEVKDKKILIIGSGGAARAVAFELAKNNKITISNRTVEKAERLAKEIAEKLNKSENEVEFSDLNINVGEFDIVIHTTPVGMYPNVDVEPVINCKDLNENMVVMDLIYNPIETVLLKEAKKFGAKTINGLGMLIYQGAIAFEIWTGEKPNVEVMKDAIENTMNIKAEPSEKDFGLSNKTLGCNTFLKGCKERRKMEVIGLEIPIITGNENLDLAELISEYPIEDGDIIVIAETIISKLEKNLVKKDEIVPSKEAIEIAEKLNKDPEVVQIILDETNEVVKMGPNFIVTETKHGFVCANSGVDESNSLDYIKPLPKNPDKSADELRKKIEKLTGKKVGVIINDSMGRPFRKGSVGVAIGVSGVCALRDRKGEKDLFGRELKTTEVGIADELASAASVVMGQSNEGIPLVIIRNAPVPYVDGKGKDLIRKKEEDVFR